MSTKNINSVVSILSVKNFEAATSWYKRLFGREPDVVPMEGIAEWQLAEKAWVQVTTDPERAGTAIVVLVVDDLDEQCKICAEVDLSVGEIVEYPGVVRMVDMTDPEGNQLSFVQDLSQ